MSDDLEVYIKAIDTETTIHEKYGPSPHNGMARAVYIGWKNMTSMGRITSTLLDTILENDNSYSTLTKSITSHPPMFLAGHNIKFDLLHLLQYDPTLIERIVRLGVTLWDTQLATYLDSGQTRLFPTLNDVSVAHGLPVKDDTITKMFKDGIGADKIDPETILPYLSQDVNNTLGIATKQLEYLRDKEIPFYLSQMDALLAITEMEYNGIRVDLIRLADLGTDNLIEQQNNMVRIISYILDAVDPTSVSRPAQGAFTNAMNLGSNELISAIIFGGEYKYTVTTPMKDKDGNPVLWKSGKKKGEARVVHDECVAVFPGIVSADYAVATKKAGVYKVDEQQLQQVLRQIINGMGKGTIHTVADKLLAEQFVKDLLNLRRLTKEYGTYIDGLTTQLYPNAFLHGTINQCATSTGRTSSSNPNLQNLPSGDDSQIKSMFISRWGGDGVIVEADYKQLEVIALAVLSKDIQLIDDILNGRDIHTETGKSVYGHTMSHDERRVVKGVNFAIIYGAGVKGLASANNISSELAAKLLSAFYTRYPGVKQWQERFATDVSKEEPLLTGKNLPNGKPQHAIKKTMPTGRILTFTEYEVPPWAQFGKGPKINLSPTELKNYPVQSLATGDIVPMMLGVMLKAIINAGLYDAIKMIVTVHDSIVFDVHRDELPKAIALIRETLESVPEHLEKLGIKTPLPFKVDISYGPNWKDQTKVLDK